MFFFHVAPCSQDSMKRPNKHRNFYQEGERKEVMDSVVENVYCSGNVIQQIVCLRAYLGDLLFI